MSPFCPRDVSKSKNAGKQGKKRHKSKLIVQSSQKRKQIMAKGEAESRLKTDSTQLLLGHPGTFQSFTFCLIWHAL